MLLAPSISTPAARIRVLHGVVLPEVPATPRQQTFQLVAAAGMPRGYHVERRATGLQLVRESDGAGMGIMPDADFAATHACMLARMEAMRQAQTEDAA